MREDVNAKRAQLFPAAPENKDRGMDVLRSIRHNRFFLRFASFLFALGLGACGAPGPSGDSSGETVTVLGELTCSADNDCDGDGVYTVCDEDDADIDAAELDPACDEDDDGFADSPCTTFAEIDGDDFFGDAERMEYGVNCDTCPGMYDPDQEDEDGDGVGDLCVAVNEGLAPDINLNAVPSEEDPSAGEGDAGATEAQGSENVAGGDGVENPQDGTAADPGDADGDGLDESIDPDPEKANSWGYVDADDYDEAGCVPEKAYNDYDYVKGTSGFIKTVPAASRTMKTAKVSSGVAVTQDLSVAGLDRVSGVTDKSRANLATYACVGASAEDAFDYGIYIVSSGAIQKAPGVFVGTADAAGFKAVP